MSVANIACKACVSTFFFVSRMANSPLPCESLDMDVRFGFGKFGRRAGSGKQQCRSLYLLFLCPTVLLNHWRKCRSLRHRFVVCYKSKFNFSWAVQYLFDVTVKKWLLRYYFFNHRGREIRTWTSSSPSPPPSSCSKTTLQTIQLEDRKQSVQSGWYTIISKSGDGYDSVPISPCNLRRLGGTFR